MTGILRRAFFLVVGIATAVGVLIGVVLSPLLLARFATLFQFDAGVAAQVGGSYGAASALLSAIALCMVALSALLQVRQTRIGQLQASRTLQLELLRMAMDKPEYRSVLGDEFKALTPTAWREHAYLNLWVMYLQMAFLTGAVSAAGVYRIALGEVFGSRKGLDYWTTAEPSFRAEASTRGHKRFLGILRRACAEGLRLRAEAERPVPGPARGGAGNA